MYILLHLRMVNLLLNKHVHGIYLSPLCSSFVLIVQIQRPEIFVKHLWAYQWHFSFTCVCVLISFTLLHIPKVSKPTSKPTCVCVLVSVCVYMCVCEYVCVYVCAVWPSYPLDPLIPLWCYSPKTWIKHAPANTSLCMCVRPWCHHRVS